MLEKQSQGQQAVKSGKIAETTIYHILTERGYLVERQRLTGTGLFGSQLRVDFYIQKTDKFPQGLIIESKWQEKAGSVDEKFPYLLLNIENFYPCPTIVICAGGGARSLAIDYLRKNVSSNKLYAVFSFEEFLTWTIRNL